MPPLVTLTTDFGWEMGYVGQMKGVILSICPQVQLIDITHEIPPQNIDAAALVLEQTAPRFPTGTIHLVVVDPGVGWAREGVAVTTKSGVFVGPDNGLFGGLDEVQSIVALENENYFLSEISSTFHGRDIFAPVAGHLACGLAIERLGSPRDRLVEVPRPSFSNKDGRIAGRVIAIDRFGNLITDIRPEPDPNEEDSLVYSAGSVQIGETSIPVALTYAEVARGEALAYVGSSNRLEIAVNRGNAATHFGAEIGTKVLLHNPSK